MKAIISLDKDSLKIKGKGKNIIIPLDPRYGITWEEPNDDGLDTLHLYEIMNNNENFVEPNNNG